MIKELKQIRDALVECKLKLQHSTYEPATHKEMDHVTSWNGGVDACIATLDRMSERQGDTKAAALLNDVSEFRASQLRQTAETIEDITLAVECER